ncbi:molybdenum transport protein ModD [Providencia rustigianii]|nr:molybdenum transport protein ModD [Providencia rustigianii]
MIYLPDALIDQLLLDDVQYGDLTTRALGLQSQQGTMTFTSKLGKVRISPRCEIIVL